MFSLYVLCAYVVRFFSQEASPEKQIRFSSLEPLYLPFKTAFMRLFLTFLLVLFFWSCDNTAEKKKQSTDTSSALKKPPAPEIPDTIFTGFGTEPFWSIYVIKDKKIVFHPADGPDVEVPFVAVANAARDTYQYNSTSGSNSIELVMEKKECSDGMSEEKHEYAVSLLINKKKYTGCGREGK